MSFGVAFAGGGTTAGVGRSSRLITVIEGLSMDGVFEKEKRFRVKCCMLLGTNSARSSVESIVLAVETSKQCLRVSSETISMSFAL